MKVPFSQDVWHVAAGTITLMMVPGSPEDLAEALAVAQRNHQTIQLCGNSTKDRMGGPISAADVRISTTKLNRVLQYEPNDLTISVEAGIPYRELLRVLAEHRQMIPLDPPFSENATIGGIVGANASGPRRRLYGTARDMVIGMTFATLEGKLIRSGGMVVKNVAGLDMGKLMIGSFGTLAAVAVINFRLHPMPAGTRTFMREFVRSAEAIAARDKVLKGPLQPAAVDIVKSAAGYDLMIQGGGSPAVLDRYSRELPGARVVEGAEEQELWERIREFTPRFLREHAYGVVVRISCTLSEVGQVLETLPAPVLARAGSGVCYWYYSQPGDLRHIERLYREGHKGKCVVEFAPHSVRETSDLWPEPGTDFAMMKKVKEMFDPQYLLNPGRLYGRI
ncbi:MAG TPA: FAD-binding oxidoreductase [Bryobacteraceae bacterium]|nr:FAD-binding oxidoreductase [Bryobacteraceae bacterium]